MSVADIVRNLTIMLWNGMVALESHFLEVKVRLTDNNVRFKILSFKVKPFCDSPQFDRGCQLNIVLES